MSLGFPGSSDGKESSCNGGDLGSISGEGHGNPFQYSFLEKPMDRGAWPATVHGVTKSQTRLSTFTFTETDIPSSIVDKETSRLTILVVSLALS